ncbi:MAG: spore maturation protein [Bacillota bacterium]|jgi:spore maturation protein B|nr:spore maturation protein [Bacillota bacterium]MDK2926240.1 spore maturation protein [Bacillota bacterium]MDK2960579.1 spore maturation protein [Bacillota bacterium]
MAGWFLKASNAAVPLFVFLVLILGWRRGVRVYETFIDGAKEGFEISVRLIPYLVGMLAAIGALRASGLLDFILAPLRVPLDALGFPVELLPLALTRSLSGSASFALMVDALQAYGPDSFLGRTASTMQGATDTTLYILTVYFGSVGVKRTRYALLVGLLADAAGIGTAVLISRLVWG